MFQSGRRVFDLVEQHPKVRVFLLSHDPDNLVKISKINNSRSDTSVSSDISDDDDDEEDEYEEEEEDLGYDGHHLLLPGKMHELDVHLEKSNGDTHRHHHHAHHNARESEERESLSDLTESPTY